MPKKATLPKDAYPVNPPMMFQLSASAASMKRLIRNWIRNGDSTAGAPTSKRTASAPMASGAHPRMGSARHGRARGSLAGGGTRGAVAVPDPVPDQPLHAGRARRELEHHRGVHGVRVLRQRRLLRHRRLYDGR